MEEVVDSQSDNVVVASDVNKQVKGLIVADNKHEFIALIQAQLEKERHGISKVELCPHELLRWICSHGAVDCATALLEGETGLAVDLNIAFEDGLYPLHYAARSLSSSLTGLLLQHGARTDLCCSDEGSMYAGMPPLSVALERICNHIYLRDWSPQKSVFQLIYILCLPKLRKPLDAIKLLALNTEELLVISLCIAREGRLLELATLLMVAQERLMITAADTDVSCIKQCIMRELQLEIDEEFKLMSGKQHSEAICTCKRRKKLFLSAAVIFAVFDRAGHVLEKYSLRRRLEHKICKYLLAVEVAFLLKVAGFKLKRSDIRVDDINCFLDKLGPKQAAKLRRSLKMKQQSGSHFSNPAAHVYSFDYLKENNLPGKKKKRGEVLDPCEDFIDYALLSDDEEQFADDVKFLAPCVDTPKRYREKFFFFDSVKCATAVLKAETGLTLDYNAAFSYNGLPALHNAAAYECPKLTKLFLEHNGAEEANFRCDCEPVDVKGMHLPLNVALEMIRRSEGIFDWDWTPKKSVFKLVFRLCGEDKRFGLKNVRLLVQKTNEIDKEIYYYLKEGKVAELAALLMVALDKLMTTPLPQENDINGRTKIRPFVLDEIASLSALSARSMYALGCKKEVQEWKNKKAMLEDILLLLEIVERIGEQLYMYLQLEETNYSSKKLAKEVAWIFMEGGFDVKCDLIEDIQRMGGLPLCIHYIETSFAHDIYMHPMRWRTFFDDTLKWYHEFPTRKSYRQALSASKRPSRQSTVVVTGSRSYHALPTAKANLDFELMTRAKKMNKVQNLEFSKLFLAALTRWIRYT